MTVDGTSGRPARQSSATDPSGTVFDVQRYAIHDGGGIRTLVFLKGCPLRCPWCHNPEGQRKAPEVMRYADGSTKTAGRRWSVQELVRTVERDTIFYDESGGGVTVSGGDPLLQPDFLRAFLAACKARELRTAVETSGYAPWPHVERVLPFVDLWLYDLKLMDPERHRRWTGVANRRILDNLQRLNAAGARVIVRVPVVPGVNDDRENLEATARFVAGLGGVEEVHLLPYHRTALSKYERLGLPYALAQTPEPTAAEMEGYAAIVRGFALRTKVGG